MNDTIERRLLIKNCITLNVVKNYDSILHTVADVVRDLHKKIK